MKIQVLTACLVLVFSIAAIPAFPQGAQPDLPNAAKAYIQENFPNERIVSAMRDDDTMGFDVTLSEGTELDFDRQGKIREVDGRMKAIPDSVVPSNILTYVSNQYAGQEVRKIEKEPYGYEVTLLNGTELKFDRTGKFLRVDESVPTQ